MYNGYLKHWKYVKGLGLDGRRGQWDILMLESDLKADIDFITSGKIYTNMHLRV